MQATRKLCAVILAVVLILSMTGTVSATQPRDAEDCIQQLINYYRYHQDAAATDIECLLYELSLLDPAKAEIWRSIMDYWHSANTDMTYYDGVIPDGLPQDDSLCIVVMGYALASNGTMKKELVGRLQTALASAEKYPNAYIVCTGGGTASDKKSATEAGEMSKWLIQKGIDPNRIIVEDKAMSTVGNALYTTQILFERYPHVTHLALVTSDYHLPRSCLLFYAQAETSFAKGMPLLCVAANAAYNTSRSAESVEIQADNLSQLVKVPINGMPKPALSKLSRITVAEGGQCTAGEDLNLQVTAFYDTGFFRDVSGRVKYSGFDFAAAGLQTVTVTYEEGGIAASCDVQIEMLIPETEPPTEAPTEAPTEMPTETNPPTQPLMVDFPDEDAPSLPRWVLPVGIIILLLIAEAFVIKQFVKNRKRQKAAAAEAKKQQETAVQDPSAEYI